MSENNQIFNISFPKELLKKVDAIADEQFGSRSEFLRTACQEYIRRDEAWKTLFEYGKKFVEQGDAESESDVALKVNEIRSIGIENLTDLERN